MIGINSNHNTFCNDKVVIYRTALNGIKDGIKG